MSGRELATLSLPPLPPREETPVACSLRRRARTRGRVRGVAHMAMAVARQRGFGGSWGTSVRDRAVPRNFRGLRAARRRSAPRCRLSPKRTAAAPARDRDPVQLLKRFLVEERDAHPPRVRLLPAGGRRLTRRPCAARRNGDADLGQLSYEAVPCDSYGVVAELAMPRAVARKARRGDSTPPIDEAWSPPSYNPTSPTGSSDRTGGDLRVSNFLLWRSAMPSSRDRRALAGLPQGAPAHSFREYGSRGVVRRREQCRSRPAPGGASCGPHGARSAEAAAGRALYGSTAASPGSPAASAIGSAFGAAGMTNTDDAAARRFPVPAAAARVPSRCARARRSSPASIDRGLPR